MASLPTLLMKGFLVGENLSNKVPIEYVIEYLDKKMAKVGVENRLLVLKSETASGKSTVFPPYLYNHFVQTRRTKSILCTQPRILTAIENVHEITKYNKNLRLGHTIGWQTKYNKFLPQASHFLLSATIGILTMQLKTLTDEEIMAKYSFILIDEVHERDINTDIAIYMLRNFLQRNKNKPKCPFVILMSATINPEALLNYFGCDKDNFIWCQGASHGIETFWAPVSPNFVLSIESVVADIIKNGQDDFLYAGDILVFLPGAREISNVNRKLTELNKTLVPDNVFTLLTIESVEIRTEGLNYKLLTSIPLSEHKVEVDGVYYPSKRRVILSTNVAETGVTLENLKYVIDTGFVKEKEYNPDLKLHYLISKPAPKSRITQRRGRVGRKFPGQFFPLYPKSIYDSLPEQQPPQILIDDISPILFSIIDEQLKSKFLIGEKAEFKTLDISMLDPPAGSVLASSIETSYLLGFMAPKSQKYHTDVDKMLEKTVDVFGFTKLGTIAKRIDGVSMEDLRMILSGYYWDFSVLDLITISAFCVNFRHITIPFSAINWRDIYAKAGLERYMNDIGLYYKGRTMITDDFIDGLMLFIAAKNTAASDLGETDALSLWCDEVNIDYPGLIEIIKKREEIVEQFIVAGFNLFNAPPFENIPPEDFMNTVVKIKHCIYDGYRANLVFKTNEFTYKTLSGIPVTIPTWYERDRNQSMYQFTEEILPNGFIYKNLSLVFEKKSKNYYITAEKLCSLDGVIDPDHYFV